MNVALLLIAGLVFLIVGGELLVRGSVAAARRLGISPLMIGLTLVGFGTSTPELVTSVHAASIGQAGISVGNIVGSNLANILLVIGASALIFPIQVPRSALRRDGVLMFATALLFAAVSTFHLLDRFVGVVFLVVLVAYLVLAYRTERTAPEVHTAALDRSEVREVALTQNVGPSTARRSKRAELTLSVFVALAGIACVVLGGRFFVDGAVGLSRALGVSESTIGLTVVALGTSMPELVTSLVAAYRKHSDLALGNVLGSNIYNVLMIGGLTGIIAPIRVPDTIVRVDNPVMLAASLLLLIFASSGMRIGRIEGLLLLLGYVAYVCSAWI